MSLQIVALLLVVAGFSGLVLWVYSPSNKTRFDEGSRLPLDDPRPIPAEAKRAVNAGTNDE